MNTPDSIASDWLQSVSDRREAGDPAFVETFIRPRPHLFSNVPVFLSADAVADMQECAQLPSYQASVLSWAPQIAQQDHGPVGALMGYDFHLGGDGPRLIEVNTNAGGAFLNALLARAQRARVPTWRRPRA